jgi:hypothetical protein
MGVSSLARGYDPEGHIGWGECTTSLPQSSLYLATGREGIGAEAQSEMGGEAQRQGQHIGNRA